ncbi:MAG: hypothetical protein JO354_11730 [Verrucomicrobia bacterium]|nr:hypothetical protein [Verrucomicrobiota bacterium]
MEDNVTDGVEQLSRDLRDVERAMQSDQQSAQNGKGDRTAETLSQLRALRQQLEQQSDRSGQQQGNQSGQPGQQGGQAGQQGGQQQARNGTWSPYGAGNPGIDRQGLQSAIGDLYALRGQIDPRDRALWGDLNGTLGYLRHLYDSQPGLLQSAISQDAVTSLERLEAELNRRVGQQQAEGARLTAPESSPEKYRDAVAEYFKKLSQPK